MRLETLLRQLKEKFGDEINDRFFLPKAFMPFESDSMKAIYLGCDPTYKQKNIPFDLAFSHGCMDKGFVKFRMRHLKQLEAIDLNRETVYT